MQSNPLKKDRTESFTAAEPSPVHHVRTLPLNQGAVQRKPWTSVLEKILDSFFSTRAAGMYILIFAAAIAAATFIENDFGTSSAQKLIYQAWWLELILVLFGISLLVNINRFNMIRQKKWAVLTFHAAMIVILIGSGVTRYFGNEGIMHIREGSTSNTFLSDRTYLQFQVINQERKYTFEEPVLFASLGDNHWTGRYLLGNEVINIEVLEFIPNPQEVMVNDETGIPVLQLVMGGANGRQEYFIKYGEHRNIQGTIFNFSDHQLGNTFNIDYQNGQLLFTSNKSYSQLQMATQKFDTLSPGTAHPLLLRSLYASGNQSFVVGEFSPQAKVEIVSSADKMESNSLAALRMKISNGHQQQETIVYGGKGAPGRPRVLTLGNTQYSVSYGAKAVALPFSIKLNDFIMERYPGTNSASSYASEVTLLVPQKNINRDQRIYMNHILNYRGYRFFQSSYDKDELGTYLSVNQDRWGTWLSYVGYALLTLGMILTMFDKSSRFRHLVVLVKNVRKKEIMATAILAGIMVFSSPLLAADNNQSNAVDANHARQFGELVMQDHNGRFKPMNTFANEVLRKISRKEQINGLTSEQVILGMAARPEDWFDVPLIKQGKHPQIHQLLQTREKLVSYREFFTENGAYRLMDAMREAFNKLAKDRGALEKELLKLDERVNICNMIFSGQFMRTFPLISDKNNAWHSPGDVHIEHRYEHEFEFESEFESEHAHGDSYVLEFYNNYMATIRQALQDNDWEAADALLVELQQYQKSTAGHILPSEAKINAELLLNKSNVFNRLSKYYGLLSIVFLTLLFISVFKPSLKLTWPFKISLGLLLVAFTLHTFGLGLRWYVSGRAPWSNGYESMIYIGFTTVLAGLLFSRKSMGGLAACSILASTILMVAGLSWLDPEITPLVPVLKSYWLTIHVSLEAGSYGFLMLGAIIGIVNLILMIFGNQKNGRNTYRIIKEMTYLSEITLISGLFMISIGTYLGGVWANESWGRYWGWDAKETWALVTILVYAFILHMRFIPGFRGFYAFNVASLFGWASVMMTYFGVNYYLSGLHSYAAGDPVPAPPFVYYTVFTLIGISLLAYWRHRVYNKTHETREFKAMA